LAKTNLQAPKPPAIPSRRIFILSVQSRDKATYGLESFYLLAMKMCNTIGKPLQPHFPGVVDKPCCATLIEGEWPDNDVM
jgi:hypothetical protein